MFTHSLRSLALSNIYIYVMSTIVYGKPIPIICMLIVSFGSLKRSADYNFRLQFLILLSSGQLKPTCDTRIIHFYYTLEQLYTDENNNKCSLRNEKLKANRTSETEEQRKERLKIRCEKIEQEGEPKNYKTKRKGRQKQKTTRNSDWTLSKD